MDTELIMAAIIAAGIRANPKAMLAVKRTAANDKMDTNRVIAIWANTQVEFIVDENRRHKEELQINPNDFS